MTMIACTINNGYPIIHSDLLVSSQERSSTFYIPALTGNVMDLLPENSKMNPVALNRKLNQLNDRICFSFSGNVAIAGRFLDDLKAYCSFTDSISKEMLSNFLEEYDRDELDNEVTFLIVLMDLVDEHFYPIVFYNNDCLVKEDSLFGQMFILGSGKSDFLEAVSQVSSGHYTVPESPSEALQLNMALVSSLLSQERLFQDSLRNNWGAGIETIYFDGQRFVRLEQVTFVFNHWFKGQEDLFGHPIPAKVTNYQYVNETLLIVDVTASKWSKTSDEDNIIFELANFNTGIFVVSGINNKIEPDRTALLAKLSFQSTFCGMGYIITDKDKLFVPSGFHGIRDVSVTYRHNRDLFVKVQRNLYDRIKNALDGYE